MSAVSAFSYAREAEDLWIRRIERKFLEKAPRLEKPGAVARFVCPGVSSEIAHSAVDWAENEAFSYAPAERGEITVARNLTYELVFPVYSWRLYDLEQCDHRAACLKAYNLWTNTFNTNLPFHGSAAMMVPPGVGGLVELERCIRNRWHKAAIIPAASADDLPVALLRRAAEAGLVVLMFQTGGADPAQDFPSFARQSHALAKAVADRVAGEHKLLVPLAESDDSALDERLNYVASARRPGADADMLWGRFDDTVPMPDVSDDPDFAVDRICKLLSISKDEEDRAAAHFAMLRKWLDAPR